MLLKNYLKKLEIRPQQLCLDPAQGHFTPEMCIGFSKKEGRWYGWSEKRWNQCAAQGPALFDLMMESGCIMKSFKTKRAAERFAFVLR